MKCPNCGQWNRASLPRCFKCGTALVRDDGYKTSLPIDELEEKFQRTQEELPIQYRIDDFGNESPRQDPKDQLALEMRSYHERKRRGEERQRQLRESSAKLGYAPISGAHGSAYDNSAMYGTIEYDDFIENPTRYGSTSDIYRGGYNTSDFKLPKKHFRRSFGIRRILPILAVIFFISGILVAGYFFLFKPLVLDRNVIPEEMMPEIIASILNDAAAHTIRIPGEEGAQIYIKELRKSFMVIGGYASFQVQDYTWYELIEENPSDKSTWLPETMEVTLTPYIRSETGEQVALPLIQYNINIPQSPLLLISPTAKYIETSMQTYKIEFQVMTNSQVYINGKDYSSFVNTQDGFISYNAPITPIGENFIEITVRSQYYRMNTVNLIIYRAVQDIPLELDPTLDDESSKERMPIFGTTRAGATITVLSPHRKLDTSELSTMGKFNFDALFEHYGTNTVRIQADYPGKNSTIIEYNVYFLPNPNTYTTRAWAINDGFGYQDLLANLQKRVEKTQVYVMTGEAIEIISEQPQLMVFDVSDGKTANKLPVLLENQTKTKWELGKRYNIYADAYGMYDNMPRLIARYTYKPKN
ncbi:MAG: hypothetical protein GX337_05735 [Christensenellaceae bacterium]|nr:hypothetical protein [Christensenellaceae bacterium]